MAPDDISTPVSMSIFYSIVQFLLHSQTTSITPTPLPMICALPFQLKKPLELSHRITLHCHHVANAIVSPRTHSHEIQGRMFVRSCVVVSALSLSYIPVCACISDVYLLLRIYIYDCLSNSTQSRATLYPYHTISDHALSMSTPFLPISIPISSSPCLLDR
jgi:hypothetical protein